MDDQTATPITIRLPSGGTLTLTRDVPGRRPKATDETRHCPRCGTRLNRYNPGPNCHAHQPFKTPRLRGRNPS